MPYVSTSLVFVLALVCVAQVGHAEDVARFGLLEATFQHSGTVSNPYTDLSAKATLTAPDGSTRTVPLFWDGGDSWKLRFSPDQVGTWGYSIQSADAGLGAGGGSFNVLNSTNHGGIQRMASSPSHFQYQDGTPMWFMGDTQWALFYNSSASSGENLNPATRQAYIDKRASQGFNAIHSQVLFGPLNENTSTWTNSGGTPFNTTTRTFTNEALNPAFFQQLDQDVAYLNQKGITSGMVLAWAEIPDSSEYDYRSFPDAAARLRYAEYVAARYSAYNVYFVVSGEWQKSLDDGAAKLISASDYTALGQKVAETDPHGRLITIHNWNETPSNFGNQDWTGFGEYRQVYSKLHQAMLSIRAAYPDKPGVASEYAYYLRDQDGNGSPDKPNSGTVSDIRHATWDVAMAGGYFITGFGSTYYGGMRHPTAFDSEPDDPEWEEQVQHVKALFSGLPWWTLEPADALITAATAQGDAITRDTADVTSPAPRHQSHKTFWALADEGQTYIGYFRGIDGVIRIDLGDVSSATYAIELFDPRTGQFQSMGTYTGEDAITLTSPSTADWVIVARVVPEPASAALLGLGAGAVLARRRR